MIAPFLRKSWTAGWESDINDQKWDESLVQALETFLERA